MPLYYVRDRNGSSVDHVNTCYYACHCHCHNGLLSLIHTFTQHGIEYIGPCALIDWVLVLFLEANARIMNACQCSTTTKKSILAGIRLILALGLIGSPSGSNVSANRENARADRKAQQGGWLAEAVLTTILRTKRRDP